MNRNKQYIDHIQDLCSATRYRTALDELAQVLRHEPHDRRAQELAEAVLHTHRSSNLGGAEPITPQQYSSAIFAPLAMQCSLCTTYWFGNSMRGLYPRSGGFLRGRQCPVCAFTVCDRCFSADTDACPTPGCSGRLAAAAHVTGRREVPSLSADDVERIVVVRAGPIPPTDAEALDVVMGIVPIVPQDAPLIIRAIGAGVHQMVDQDQMLSLGEALVASLEFDGQLSRDSLRRATYVSEPQTRDSAACLVVVIALEPGRASARSIALLQLHLDRVRQEKGDPGQWWKQLSSDPVLEVAAEQLELAMDDAARLDRLSTRTRLLPGLVVLTTAVPGDADPVQSFPTGYFDYLDRFARSFRTRESGLTLCNWVARSDGSSPVVDLTVLPSDQHDLALIAQDHLSPSEKQSLGL